MNPIFASAGQVASVSESEFNEIVRRTGVSSEALGIKPTKIPSEISFNIGAMDNGYVITVYGRGRDKRFVAKTGHEILEVIAGQLTALRIADAPTDGNFADNCEAAQQSR